MPEMTRRKALRIAIAAMRRRRHVIAVDANIFLHANGNYPHAEKCAREFAQLNEAIHTLEEELKQ